ncbi:MAG: fimbria major subunit [Muribaculaceae bacterium]|nr:fimbria major subunit [Muribaculaceae bacterium]
MLKKLKYIFGVLFLLGMSGSIWSCSDDLSLNGETKEPGAPDDPENYLVVPFAISTDILADTRAFDDETLVSGNANEHAMDFGIKNECFALFFHTDGSADGDRFMYLKELNTHTGLGNGILPDDNIGEYKVYVVAYIDKPEGYDNMTVEQRHAALPDRVLVVLNGGKVYEFLNKFIEEKKNRNGVVVENLSSKDFLDFQWKSSYYEKDSEGKDTHVVMDDNILGRNEQMHYTMTNSAYYDYDEIVTVNENGTLTKTKDTAGGKKLQTVAKIYQDNIKEAFSSNIKRENVAAEIFVERMVAKFSEPVFSTEVVGARRVFRPSQSAETMMIYSWGADGALHSEIADWRVHVLGWTINGREKSNYLYKHIIQAYEKGLDSWEESDWNDGDHKRSYWSIDPHYDGETDFYPWQYRGAVDKNGISAVHHNEDDIALRYIPFNQLLSWTPTAQYFSENTFDPVKYKPKDNGVLDGRATYLAGPHLLMTAELYIESAEATEDDYLGQYKTVDHLYSDRIRRFYLDEKDWFRMFVVEFNEALEAQEQMKFFSYKWDESGNDTPPEYYVFPSGNCALMFDIDLLERKSQSERTSTDQYLIEHRDKFHGKTVESVLDLLFEGVDSRDVKLSMDCTAKDGDGRLIPWIDGMVFRNKENFGEILPVKASPDKNAPNLIWDNDLRKSLIFQWFGPVDHYYKGYMYYAADIPHHVPATGTPYYGTVRNHWYSFTIKSINSIGTPVDNISQPIIPGRYNYRDQIGVFVDIISDHTISNSVEFPN